jgi:hypothetical protein
MGGAVFNNGGTVTITDSTLTGNTATGGAGGAGGVDSSGRASQTGSGGSGFGGAIFNRNGTLTVLNSTIANNAAFAGAAGLKGPAVAGAGTTTLGAAGSAGGGGIYNLSDGAGGIATVNLANSIISGSTAPSDLVNNRNNPGAGSAATINASTPNIVQTAILNQNGGVINAGGVMTVNPLLSALVNHGGPTSTLALLSGSPAINTGSNAAAVGLTTDQRGFNRIVNLIVDIGAYEFQPSPTATTTTLVSSLNPSQLGQAVVFTATMAGNVPGSNTPTGTVTFTIDGTAGTPVMVVNGTATFTISTLTAGSHTIVATYNGGSLGDITFTASTSATLTQVVQGPVANSGLIATGTDVGGGPEVKVFDAASGALKQDFLAYDPAFRGGVRVAVGDVNNDGILDIVTVPGHGGGPLVKVFSAKDLSLILSFNAYDPSFTGGLFVAVADVNHDGFSDIITAPDKGGGPLVKVFSGKDGSLLMSFNAYDPAFLGGVRVAAGDVNGDGFADIITAPGSGGGPEVKAFSGASGALLLDFLAYNPAFRGGLFVAAGDVNGDGKADIVVTAGVGGGPLINVFNGINQGLLLSFNAYPPVASPLSIFGSDSVWQSGLHVAALDVNGDGKADIITGVGPSQRPEVKVFDGATLAVLDDFFAYDPTYLGGVFVGAGK